MSDPLHKCDQAEDEISALKAKIATLEGRSMKLQNGKAVSELEYYRLRWPSIAKWAKEQQNEQ